ncbi:hypothetical protein [Parasphingorhabdus sp.]|uniref:hypothetical protein n=1 Tax=Parasphingorhabdus sp. TaxID=2709688 RepID=UPI0030ACC175|nr:hypothetical protein [Sphingomonadales bacterium]
MMTAARLAAIMVFALAVQPGRASAYPLIVVEARGGGEKPGDRIDSKASVVLGPGGKLVVISPDGRVISLRGPFKGPPVANAVVKRNPRAALAALVTTRNDRAATVGAVRSGSSAAPLPGPWLIDISRPGDRCLLEGAEPVWWRPQAVGSASFSVEPIDHSWRADFVWQDGVDRMLSPGLLDLKKSAMLNVRTGDQERPVRLQIVPGSIDDPLVMTAWLLEKGCFQQADALMASASVTLTMDMPSVEDEALEEPPAQR